MDLDKMRKNFTEIKFREDINPPDMEDVITCIWESLECLDPARYEIKLVESGKNRTFNISKDGQLLGKYRVKPGTPGGSIWYTDDPQQGEEWDRIWLTIWTDVAGRFGRWPWVAGEAQPEMKQTEPWKSIQDILWDRQAIQMLWGGYTIPEIAKRFNLSKGRVSNRITELRNKYGSEIIPYKNDRGKNRYTK